MGAIDTRPAIRETRCCDDRRLGRGDEGERVIGGITGVMGRHIDCGRLFGEEVIGKKGVVLRVGVFSGNT